MLNNATVFWGPVYYISMVGRGGGGLHKLDCSFTSYTSTFHCQCFSYPFRFSTKVCNFVIPYQLRMCSVLIPIMLNKQLKVSRHKNFTCPGRHFQCCYFSRASHSFDALIPRITRLTHMCVCTVCIQVNERLCAILLYRIDY